jgi:ribosomal protein S18 acetylase RimI-like enzyme
MTVFRTFRNTDPPALVAIWRSCAGQPGLAQPVSVDRFEQSVFGKLYFDYEGLILAFDEDRPVGFAHAAFGPHPTWDRVATQTGVICLVLVRPDCAQADEVAEGLLQRCEAYLRRHRAAVVYGGAVRPVNPFYLGLYGRSELPGVLESDLVATDLYRSHGYREIDRTVLFRRRLDDFRPPVDRRQVQLRRQMSVNVMIDPPARHWWEACTTADFDLTRFEVTERGIVSVLASATFRGMEVNSRWAPARASGLLDVDVDPSHRRRGLATFLLAESFRQLARQGVATVEAQASQQNAPGVALCRKLGMEQVEQGVVFRKQIV